MKMKFYKVLGMGLLAMGTSVFADTVAIVDLYKVVRSLPNLDKVQEDMQKETTLAQGKLNNKKVQLDAKVQEFESNKDTLSEQKIEKMRKEIIALQRDLKYLESDLREDLAMHEQDQKNMLLKQAMLAAKQYAIATGCDLVLNAQDVVYAADSKDITTAVIASLEPQVAPAAVTTPPVKAVGFSKKSDKK